MSRRDFTGMHLTTHPPAAAEHAVGLEPEPRTRLRALGDSLSAGVGVALGIAPHVLHHIGLIAGAALVTGTGGNRWTSEVLGAQSQGVADDADRGQGHGRRRDDG